MWWLLTWGVGMGASGSTLGIAATYKRTYATGMGLEKTIADEISISRVKAAGLTISRQSDVVI